MELSDDAKAILLLTGHLRTRKSLRELGLLNSKQWNRLRLYLEQNEKSPGDLFEEETILHQWAVQDQWYPSENASKCVKLLRRGTALADATSYWESLGFWILTYLDDDYPWRLKERLSGHKEAYPVLYGTGDRSLLQHGGLAVVGSRRPPEDLEDYYFDYARSLGEEAAEEEVTIISGGATGVDIHAMQGSLKKAGGIVIGVLTHRLLEQATSIIYRDYLEEDRLALVSLVDPEINFFEVNDRYVYGPVAMQRNKYIYCLSDSAVVVRSGEKGGTIRGATENLEKGWVPLWVKHNKEHDEQAGNKIIVEKGAQWFPETKEIKDHLHLALEERDIRRAVILLTVNLSSDRSDQLKPLDFKEWGKFAKSLWGRDVTPANLIHEPYDKILKKGYQSDRLGERIPGLLSPERQNRLPQEKKNWRKAGISVLTRRDKGYPKILKVKLKHESPALVFVSGNLGLLASDQKKAAILGAKRNINETDLSYAHSFGTALAREGRVLISPNVTKTEKEAVRGALESGGKCVVLLAGKLQEILSDGGYDKYLDNQQLVLLSASAPHAAPNYTVSRQHYDIACSLSDAVVVVRSGKNDMVAKCVRSCRKRGGLPIWVRKTERDISGNELIVKQGGHWLLNGKNEFFRLRDVFDYVDAPDWLQQQKQLSMFPRYGR